MRTGVSVIIAIIGPALSQLFGKLLVYLVTLSEVLRTRTGAVLSLAQFVRAERLVLAARKFARHFNNERLRVNPEKSFIKKYVDVRSKQQTIGRVVNPRCRVFPDMGGFKHYGWTLSANRAPSAIKLQQHVTKAGLSATDLSSE